MQSPSSSLPVSASTATRWRVRLLGDLSLANGARTLTHLPSRAVAALLARLALSGERAHGREELIELLWPGVDLAVGRNRLRQALSTLKSLLEPDGAPAVLQADRVAVRVVPGALECDAVDFEQAVRAGQVQRARALYRGELMPGHFDEWIADERLRLAALADRLPAEATPAAPWPSAGDAPAYLTRFFGREADGARLRAEVLQHRLVTLVGGGGAGKTRLAVELAAALRSAPRLHRAERGVESPFDPVLFVPLVACGNRAEVLQALGAALGSDAEPAAIERALTGRDALLVLDNFEHLVDAAADIVQGLLARLPQLHLLVTSRRVLGLDGERECLLGTLPAPEPDADWAAASASPAVALFVDRARAARGDFQLERDNLVAVVGLVRALDAMPLALELAAARCRTLAPAQLLQMLQGAVSEGGDAAPAPSALSLLARRGSRGDRDPRPATMEWVVQWSWDLLPVEAQGLLADVTVFRAGASAAAVARVCDLSEVDAALRLDTLASHSLLQPARAGDDRERYAMLELIREFASAQLAPARAARLRARLRRWLIDWATGLGPVPDPARVAPELPDIHAALRSALADGAPQDAMDLALALRDYWELDGMPPQVLHALEAALAAGGSWPATLRCDAHELLAYTSIGGGDAAVAMAHAQAALALAGDAPRRRGRCLLRLAWVRLVLNGHDLDVAALLDEALALARGVADAPLEARVLNQQGALARYGHAELALAQSLFAQSQALWESLGNSRLAHARLRNRAQCWAAQGLHERALQTFQSCEAAAREAGDWVGIIDSTLGAGTALYSLRRWPQALQALRGCVAVSWQRHHAHGLAYGLWQIAPALLRVGRFDDAVVIAAVAHTNWRTHFGAPRHDDRRYAERMRRLARSRLEEARIDELWREGVALPVAEAVARVLRG